jgi:hypothetical protein
MTFGITYVYEGVLILAGLRIPGGTHLTAVPLAERISPALVVLALGGVMWVPALSTVLTIKFVTREGFGLTNFRVGPLRPYFISALVVPACFVATYGLTWLLGLGHPDWQLMEMRNVYLATRGDTSTMPSPALVLPGAFLASVLLGPTINGIFGFGEEFGWRGYLLPKLLPMGKLKAYTFLGAIWGLWHAPVILVGFNYPNYPILGIIAMMGMTTALGIYINELSLQNRSSILAGWVHGAFNGQAYGIWRILFTDVNPLISGFTGLVGMGVWLLVGLVEARRGRTAAL